MLSKEKRIPNEMKYVKLQIAGSIKMSLLFHTSESGDGRGTICDKEDAHNIHKVTTKFVEASYAQKREFKGRSYLCLPTWDTRAPQPGEIESAVEWASRKELRMCLFSFTVLMLSECY
ncbi:hypothetical protein NC651_019199 [Populus alba x Populus x berolinensis]|nr:hypothetical protein NC651_019199 [Populus alba x Populus x berolinensis]